MYSMITTIDNPFNPFTQSDQWRAFDEQNGYFSEGLLARFVKSSIEMTEQEMNLEINSAVDEIVKLNPNGMYRKVTSDTDGESGEV